MLWTVTWRTLRQLIILLLLLLVLAVAAASQINEAIFSPPRRVLQEYHMDRLTNPTHYGLTIRSHQCLEGKAPCLLVEPDALSGAGKRGKKLRRQLAHKQFELPAYGRVKGMVVLLHGRKGRKEDLLPVAERFVAAGFRCLLLDMPAHGDNTVNTMSFGESLFERDLPSKALQEVKQHFALPDEPAALWGMSMGGAFAISAASQASAEWDALMIVSSFSSLAEVLDAQIPAKWKGAVDALMPLLNMERQLRSYPAINTIQPKQSAASINIPTLLVHGERDAYVVPAQGRALYNAIPHDNKLWITVPDAGHANVLATPMPLYSEMSAWLLNQFSQLPER
ncbi:MAG: alpha/beta hydrolase [Leucothrix sp.]